MEAELLEERTFEPPGDAHQEGDGDFKMPSIEKLLEALEKLDLPEENKEQLKQNLLSGGDKMGKFGQGLLNPSNIMANNVTVDILIVLCFIAIVFLVIVFFGYKLYKSLAERERRKEEKRRQKQQKKKK